MIWTPTPPPYTGERRIVRRFAWWPVTLINGDRCWLERYYALEEYRVVVPGDLIEREDLYGWETVSLTTYDPSTILAANGVTL